MDRRNAGLRLRRRRNNNERHFTTSFHWQRRGRIGDPADRVFSPCAADRLANRPIKIIAGYPAGGQTDLFARTYGEYIRSETGQNVVVENKAGASGSVAAVEAKRAAPDGYTLMFTISTTMIMNRVLIKDIPYDAEKDFVLVSIMPAGSLPFVAGEKTGAKTLAEFVAYAKKAEKVNIGTYGAGSYAHMAIVEMNKLYGLKMEAVHYRGEAPMWTDLAGGFIDGAHGSYGAALPVLQSGRGRAVAVSRKRMSVLPDVPYLHGAGCNRAPLPVDRLPVLRRAGGDAAGNRSKTVKTPRRRRQDRKAAAAHEIIRRRRYRDDVRGDAETVQGRIAGLARGGVGSRACAVLSSSYENSAPSPRIIGIKSGKLVAMKAVSSTFTGLSAASPITSADIAMR